MAETETLTIFLETRPRRDLGTSRDRDVETETTTLIMRYRLRDSSTWQYGGTQKSDNIVQRQVDERTHANSTNTPSVGQVMQNGDNIISWMVI